MKFHLALLGVAALQVCALAAPEMRLDDGKLATRRQFPWHVQLKPMGVGQITFAGMVITDSWVLTCAACANKAASYDLTFGAWNVSDDAELNRQNRTVMQSDFIFHPDFNPSSFNVNNLCLIPLEEPLLINAYVEPVPLPAPGTTTDYAGELARVQGYGKATGDDNHVLRYTDLEVRPNSNCNSVGHAGQMCAAVTEGVAPCTDEGAALVFTDSAYRAIGIMSYGFAEGPCPGPTVLFTRVTYYLEWIMDTANITESISNDYY